jgi:hypothetical protein
MTCTTEEQHYVGEIGTRVIVDCGQPLTTATEVSLDVLKPDGTSVVWAATVHETNYLLHATVEGDFDIPGRYSLQSFVKTADGEWPGNTATFVVKDRFK